MISLQDYKKLIQEMPVEQHAFEIKKDVWAKDNRKEEIEAVFNGNKTVFIGRSDLFEANKNLDDFILKVLMWGYPTKGRGKNIDNLLGDDNYKELYQVLKGYQYQNVSLQTLIEDTKRIQGLGLSTMSKFVCFLDTKIDNYIPVILDLQIIEVMRLNRFQELSTLHKLSYENALKKYSEYLKVMNDVATNIEVHPNQLEMFLFTFGRILKG